MPQTESKSRSGQLDRSDFVKLGKSLLIASGGVLIAFAADALGMIEAKGQAGAMLAAAGAVAINTFRKWIVDNGGDPDRFQPRPRTT